MFALASKKMYNEFGYSAVVVEKFSDECILAFIYKIGEDSWIYIVLHRTMGTTERKSTNVLGVLCRRIRWIAIFRLCHNSEVLSSFIYFFRRNLVFCLYGYIGHIFSNRLRMQTIKINSQSRLYLKYNCLTSILLMSVFALNIVYALWIKPMINMAMKM